MNMKGTLIATLSAVALGVATLASPAAAGPRMGGGGGGGQFHGGGGQFHGGGGQFHGGGGQFHGGGGQFHGGGGQYHGGGGNFAMHQGGWNQGGGYRHGGGHYNGGFGWGPAIGFGLLGGALAGGAFGAYDYDSGYGDDGCYRYRPVYNQWGEYTGRRLVDVCN